MGIFQNNLLAGAAAAASAGGGGFYDYQIENSIRFENASTSRLYRTAGTPTNIDKYTFSTWIKFNKVTGSGSQYTLFGGTSGEIYEGIYLSQAQSGQLRLVAQNGGTSYEVWSEKVYRDVSGFNHILYVYDSAQGTAANRWIIYHNGVKTTLDQSRYSGFIAQNRDGAFNTSGATQNIGNGNMYSATTDGYFAETLFFDGQAYSPSDVTETKNGVLIPKDPSSLTFGNNGFHLKYENASDLGNDSSGNNNDFTASGLGTDHQVLDSPTFGS